MPSEPPPPPSSLLSRTCLSRNRQPSRRAKRARGCFSLIRWVGQGSPSPCFHHPICYLRDALLATKCDGRRFNLVPNQKRVVFGPGRLGAGPMVVIGEVRGHYSHPLWSMGVVWDERDPFTLPAVSSEYISVLWGYK